MTYDSAFGQMMYHVFGHFDLAVYSVFGFVQNDIFTFLAKFFSSFGEPIFSILVFVVGIVLACFKRTRKIGLLIVFATGLFFIVNNICLKNFFSRVRPYNTLQWNAQYFQWYLGAGAIAETDNSFPSGHTAYAFTMATTMFLWLKNDMKKSEGWLFFILATFIGLSRIYLMVHFTTDVIAGMIVGIACACIVWYGLKLLEYICSKKFPNALASNRLDMEPKLANKLGHKPETNKSIAIIVVCLLCITAFSFTKYMIGLNNVVRCDHQGPDYICMNEAYIEEYDEASGEVKNYCGLHD